MHVTYLKKEMLEHELIVRGIKFSGSNTVDELRASLRPLLKLEAQPGQCNYPPYDLDFEEESGLI